MIGFWKVVSIVAEMEHETLYLMSKGVSRCGAMTSLRIAMILQDRARFWGEVSS